MISGDPGTRLASRLQVFGRDIGHAELEFEGRNLLDEDLLLGHGRLLHSQILLSREDDP